MQCSLSPKDTSLIRTEFFGRRGLSLLEGEYCHHLSNHHVFKIGVDFSKSFNTLYFHCQVASLHTEMVMWMVQMLLHLAPDREEHSAEAKESIRIASVEVSTLQANAKSLFSRLEKFSQYLSQ